MMIMRKDRKSDFLAALASGRTLTKTLLCPAKINLFLEVTGRREDGYHTIESVMQKIALCDRVELSLSRGEGITIRSNDRTLPTGEKNLAYRAATLYLNEVGITAHTEIFIFKRIPVAAGLAGGSADAAGVLRAMDAMIGGVPRKRLGELALMLGADLPFCLFSSASLCQGLGEELSFVTPLADCVIVLAKHKRESVSTKDAYRLIDSVEYTPRSVDSMMKALADHDLHAISREMMNRFEEIILPLRPSVASIKETMLSFGALSAMMSGSGPSVFGIFEREEDAELAKNALREANCYAYLSRPWR